MNASPTSLALPYKSAPRQTRPRRTDAYQTVPDACRREDDDRRMRSRGRQEQMGGGDRGGRRRRLPVGLSTHGRRGGDLGRSVDGQGPHFGDDQAAEQILRGPRQGATGL